VRLAANSKAQLVISKASKAEMSTEADGRAAFSLWFEQNGTAFGIKTCYKRRSLHR
jgi:hypothetical protein